MHDVEWSDWKNIADGGNADTVDGKHASDFIKLTGGTMSGMLTAQPNTGYTAPQVRNVTMSTTAPSGGFNGQIHYQYS